MSIPKCEFCKWCKPRKRIFGLSNHPMKFSKCTHKLSITFGSPDYYLGSEEPIIMVYDSCSIMRKESFDCGPKGKLFEPNGQSVLNNG